MTSNGVEILVLVEQNRSEEPVVTHVGMTVANPGEQMAFSAGYDTTTDGRITPRSLFVDFSGLNGLSESERQTIKWRRDKDDWRTLSQPIYPGSDSRISFKAAQRGPWKGLTYRVEHLDQLAIGGVYTVIRISESGQELGTAHLAYPNETAVNALYAQARSQAIASLKSDCKPAGFITQGPSQKR